MSNTASLPNYTMPTIHLNGTGASALAGEYLKFLEALQKAAETLDYATCNARDFYPQGAGAYKQACKEREEAFSKLKELMSFASAWVETASARL